MKISQVKIKNFRGYKDETKIDITNLTVFVGKNDVGKSTILEALDIFFNEGKGAVKFDKDDLNKKAESDGEKNTTISVVFDDLPDEVFIDDENPTTLEQEYLLRSDKKLEIIKEFFSPTKEKVFIKAYHPKNTSCDELLSKTQTQLQAIIKKESINCHGVKNAEMRKAIWGKYANELNLEEHPVDITKEDGINKWNKIKKYMPTYALFQADRENIDGDDEVQNPMKSAVKKILNDGEIQKKLEEVSEKVNEYLKTVSDGTLEKLAEMNPDIAKKLQAMIPSHANLKWESVFKNFTISEGDGIPMNKSGSGVKRLILLNFFRSEVERSETDKKLPDIIYAMEEPETSQHLEHQRQLIEAFIALSEDKQIILTTHSPAIVRMLKFENLRLIEDKQKNKKAEKIMKDSLTSRFINEVNFLAFDEGDENYHNELYGFITHKNWFKDFKQGKDKRDYKNDKTRKLEQKTLSEYIRHQIHHPENKSNPPYTHEELQQSIMEMRIFIKENNA